MNKQSEGKTLTPIFNCGAGNSEDLGPCGHHGESNVIDVLKDEHRVIERVLAVVEKLVDAKGKPPLRNWKLALEFFRHFADQCHHFKEEQVLFPALEEQGIPSEGGPVGVMLTEHEEGRGYVRSMFDGISLLEANNPAGKDILLNGARQYLRLLREHIQKEDEVLFPMAAEVVPEIEQQKLLRMFEKHEAEEIGTGVHEKYLKIVEELEKSGN